MSNTLINIINNSDLSDFDKDCYLALLSVKKGEVISYKALARKIGKPNAARAVGNAMNRNPFAPKVPCHRVIKSDGRVGGFAFGGDKKRLLLEQEGIVILNGRVVVKTY